MPKTRHFVHSCSHDKYNCLKARVEVEQEDGNRRQQQLSMQSKHEMISHWPGLVTLMILSLNKILSQFLKNCQTKSRKSEKFILNPPKPNAKWQDGNFTFIYLRPVTQPSPVANQTKLGQF